MQSPLQDILVNITMGLPIYIALAIGLLIWAVFAPRPVDRKAQPSRM